MATIGKRSGANPTDNSMGAVQKKARVGTFEESLAFEHVHGSQGTRGDQEWARPPIPGNWASHDIVFQQIDAEESVTHGQSVVRMFGVTKEGNSVLCDITQFQHYLFVAAPPGFQKSDIEALSRLLKMEGLDVARIEVLQKQSLMNYNGDRKHPFLKLVCNEPKQVTRLRTWWEQGQGKRPLPGTKHVLSGTTYDNISYSLRCTIDCGIVGMSWLTLPAGKYSVVQSREQESRCQIEVRIPYQDLIAHEPEGEWLLSAPLRVLSFDIECAGRKGIFPDATIDPVIQIANVVQVQGAKKPFVRNVFVVGTCSPIVGSKVYEHQKEADMLMAWRDFVNQVDPDVIIGYNTTNFDFPYLINRASSLRLSAFPYFGRLKMVPQRLSTSTFTSKAFGSSENVVTNSEGRLQIDMLLYIRREYKLRTYTLNAVSAKFLEEQKEDVLPGMITELQNGNAETRHRLAVYCLKDAYLPLRLMDKLMTLVNMSEMARVTGVPLSYLLTRGQQIKVISQLFRKAREVDLVVPNLRQEGSPDEQYEGATVIEPKRGYYDVPIATLDFSSLYPSIMMAHNLCYTTLVSADSIKANDLKEGVDYEVTPTGDKFVKPTKRPGLLPQILRELLGARKRAKADLKKETDPFKRAVLDGRQLALKISANSVYGFTGATIGKLPCLPISSSTTAYGRDMIEATKQLVESHYTRSNGYENDAVVVYGDTDSVMVKFGTSDLAESMRLGEEAAGVVSKTFMEPIKLEFEKVYWPYLLINKKRYAGIYWTNTTKFDKMDTKGIETVRRDNCQLVQNVIETVLHRILIDRDTAAAESFVKETISDLLQNRVDLGLLIITKQLTRADYAGKQAHVELAERMRKRDAGSAPALGDRVPYVIIRADANAKNYEKSEDPVYVLENNVPIDTKYYLENQLSKPLLRIFEPILGEQRAGQLLTGAHTRTVQRATPTTGGLMRFKMQATARCKGCRRPLQGTWSKGAVCENCLGRVPELYDEQKNSVLELQVKFDRLWTQCQHCQGSFHQEVLCASKDCPIFFMRRKVQKELTSATTEMHRFDYSW